MFERFTTGAQKSVMMAQEEARVHHAASIDVDHLFLAILRMHDDDAVVRTLSGLSCSVPELYDQVDAQVPTGPSRPAGTIPFASATKEVMGQALQEAMARKDGHIGNEHLLLAVAANGGSVGSDQLVACGGTHAALASALGGGTANPGFQVKTTRGLGRFRRSGRHDEPAG